MNVEQANVFTWGASRGSSTFLALAITLLITCIGCEGRPIPLAPPT